MTQDLRKLRNLYKISVIFQFVGEYTGNHQINEFWLLCEKNSKISFVEIYIFYQHYILALSNNLVLNAVTIAVGQYLWRGFTFFYWKFKILGFPCILKKATTKI